MTYWLKRFMAFLILVFICKIVSAQGQVKRWPDSNVEVLVLCLAAFLMRCRLILLLEVGHLGVIVCFESLLRFAKHVDVSTDSQSLLLGLFNVYERARQPLFHSWSSCKGWLRIRIVISLYYFHALTYGDASRAPRGVYWRQHIRRI